MKNVNHTILGGGLSSLINDQLIKNAVILCDFKKKSRNLISFMNKMDWGAILLFGEDILILIVLKN